MSALVTKEWKGTVTNPLDDRVLMTQDEDGVRLHYRKAEEVA